MHPQTEALFGSRGRKRKLIKTVYHFEFHETTGSLDFDGKSSNLTLLKLFISVV